jgi:hypothetical protein
MSDFCNTLFCITAFAITISSRKMEIIFKGNYNELFWVHELNFAVIPILFASLKCNGIQRAMSEFLEPWPATGAVSFQD